jgi:hypothetical protein
MLQTYKPTEEDLRIKGMKRIVNWGW